MVDNMIIPISPKPINTMTTIELSECNDNGKSNTVIYDTATNDEIGLNDATEKKDSPKKKCECKQACNANRDHCIKKCRCFENGYIFRTQDMIDEIMKEELDQAVEEYLEKNAHRIEDNELIAANIEVNPPNYLSKSDKLDYIKVHNMYASVLLCNYSENICDCDKCLKKYQQDFEKIQTQNESNDYFNLNMGFFECNGEDDSLSNTGSSNNIATANINNSGQGRNLNLNNRNALKNTSAQRPTQLPNQPQSQQNANIPNSKIVAISFACKDDTCNLFFTDKKELAEHMFNKHRLLPFKCWAGCQNLYFSSRDAVIKHNQEVHPNTNVWKCELCPGLAYKQFDNLFLHHRREHEYGVFSCNWPNHQETFRFRQEVISHIERIHYKRGLKTTENGSRNLQSQQGGPHSSGSTSNSQGGHQAKSNDEERQYILHNQAEFDKRSRSFPPPISDEKIKAIVRTLNPLTSEEYQYFCKWPGCKKTCRYAWNLRTHIRTTHFKLPKTKLLMQNLRMNVEEIDEIESKYIHIYEC